MSSSVPLLVKEHVPFRRTTQVENYLQDVLDSQRKTLGNTLKRSLKRYPNQARVEWLMNADPPGSITKTDPAQVYRLLVQCVLAGVHQYMYYRFVSAW